MELGLFQALPVSTARFLAGVVGPIRAALRAPGLAH